MKASLQSEKFAGNCLLPLSMKDCAELHTVAPIRQNARRAPPGGRGRNTSHIK